jgi:hypothetical protein
VIVFNKLGHVTIGTLVALTLAHSPEAFMSVIIGSLLPDIDTKKSTLGRYNPLVKYMHHRGRAHRFFWIMVFALPFALISEAVYVYVVIGAFSQIFGDKLYSWLPGKSKFQLKLW